ncbi:NB-ARC domain-containing protein [Actinokineospora sp. 24-640]
MLAETLGPDGVPIVTVAGPPGVGKSALAVRAATVAADSYPGGVLFVDLHGYDFARRIDANAALGALLRVLGVQGEHIPAGQGEREVLYRSELARRSQRVLVVADNASDTGQVLPLRPGDTTHRLLVTSRHILPVPYARRIEVTVLPPDDSVAVLTDALRAAGDAIIDDPAVAAELAALCGHLPLALRITAELLADQPESAGELVGILRDTRSRLGELAYGDSAAVRAAFDASYQRLPADQARLFRLLSVHPGPHVSRAAASALVAEPVDVTRRLLDGLRRAHLIERRSRSDVGVRESLGERRFSYCPVATTTRGVTLGRQADDRVEHLHAEVTAPVTDLLLLVQRMRGQDREAPARRFHDAPDDAVLSHFAHDEPVGADLGLFDEAESHLGDGTLDVLDPSGALDGDDES